MLHFGAIDGARVVWPPAAGEDFRRYGYIWVADRSGTYAGFKNDQRLRIFYSDWSFCIKDIKYGKPVIEDESYKDYQSNKDHCP